MITALARPVVTPRSGVSRSASATDAEIVAPARERSGSWSLPAPEGAYGPLPVWTTASAWFDAVLDALASGEGEAARRRAKVAAGTLMRVAYADAASADRATGRGVTTAHETVAAQLGMSAKTV